MEKDLQIRTTDFLWDEYFEKNFISQETQNKLLTTNFLTIPTKYAESEYYFAQETIDFLKFCQQNSKEYSFDILADGDIKIRSLHSFDIWMPVIFIASEILLPIIVNIVSGYISNKMQGRENEDAQVDVTFIVKRNEEEKLLHYKGDAKTFKESFEKIDLNKM
jgi:hypothetical protein